MWAGKRGGGGGEETDVSLADSQRRFSEAQENTQRSVCCNQGLNILLNRMDASEDSR